MFDSFRFITWAVFLVMGLLALGPFIAPVVIAIFRYFPINISLLMVCVIVLGGLFLSRDVINF
jgi:hypothetical protein